MEYKNVFNRRELKYKITKEQKEIILKAIEPYMQLDQYGKTTIRNIYFDTKNYRLIRHSIDKPPYKEKLRVRSYREVDKDDEVYVELKKKYKKIVYKRRVALPYNQAMDWLCKGKVVGLNTQIEREINYFLSYYKDLVPEVFLTYDREAYYMIDGSDFRVTFDENILWREDNIGLDKEIGGTPILDDGYVLMEIKTIGGIPLWFVDILSKEHIYKDHFSKYGNAYKEIVNEYM